MLQASSIQVPGVEDEVGRGKEIVENLAKKGTKDKTQTGQQAGGTRNCSTVPLRSTESEADKEKGNLYVKQALNGRRRGEEDKEDQGGRPEREPP